MTMLCSSLTTVRAGALVYDSANNTCVEDDTDTNIINPPVTEEPTVIVETCEAFGLVYDEIEASV